MDDPTEELLPLIGMAGGGSLTIEDAIEDLASHVTATWGLLADHITVEEVTDAIAMRLWDVVTARTDDDIGTETVRR